MPKKKNPKPHSGPLATNPEAVPNPRQARPRRVFGRVRVEYGGQVCHVLMTKTDLHVHPLHARRFWTVNLPSIVALILAGSFSSSPGSKPERK